MRWTEIDKHLRRKHMVLRHEDMQLSFVADGAILSAAFAAIGTRERLVLAAEICKVHDAEQTLIRPSPLLCGALIRYRGKLMHQVVMPLEATTTRELDSMVEILSRSVNDLRKSMRIAA
jgi:hypothetical protein